MNENKPPIPMSELSETKLAKPLNRDNLNNDSLVLRQLVGFINNPQVSGAVVPPEAKQEINNLLTQQPPSPLKAPEELPASTVSAQPSTLSRKIFFTGRICAGKDFCSAAIGAKVFGFADPMYFLANYLFNTNISASEGKQLPGMRTFLQTAGQWGRNEVSEKYPYTPERAMFCLMVRSLANQHVIQSHGVDWGMYGLSKNLWVDGLLKRVADEKTDKRIAVTNCRFANEYNHLTAESFEHFHIVCSPQTHIYRFQSRGLKLDSPELKDTSEKLAIDLDRDLTKKLAEQRVGSKLHVIWNDTAPSPSPRLYTLDEFKKLAANT